MATHSVKIAKNLLKELAVCTRNPAALETERGELFIGNGIPASCIRLKTTLKQYLEYLRQLPATERPDLVSVVPVEGQPYDLVVIGNLEMHEKATYFNGREVALL
jgi:hypothetical protein